MSYILFHFICINNCRQFFFEFYTLRRGLSYSLYFKQLLVTARTNKFYFGTLRSFALIFPIKKLFLKLTHIFYFWSVFCISNRIFKKHKNLNKINQTLQNKLYYLFNDLLQNGKQILFKRNSYFFCRIDYFFICLNKSLFSSNFEPETCSVFNWYDNQLHHVN